MKELKTEKTQETELSLYEQVMNSKPEFASHDEAITAYEQRLNDHATKCGRTIKEMLHKAEYSSDFDKESFEAANLWRTLSGLRRMKKEKKL